MQRTNSSANFGQVAVYRSGSKVVVKDLALVFAAGSIRRETMKEMRSMCKEVRHDNVNPFLGAVVTDVQTRIHLVTEFCYRGSLPDILSDDDIKLDFNFIRSLLNDLIKGMAYLHEASVLRCHGNLKSSNCLVTSYWVLRLTDFGLTDLRRAANKDQDYGNQYKGLYIVNCYSFGCQDLMWISPELLRGSPSSKGVEAIQKADVYAFGLVFYEILTRQGCFSSCNMKLRGQCLYFKYFLK